MRKVSLKRRENMGRSTSLTLIEQSMGCPLVNSAFGSAARIAATSAITAVHQNHDYAHVPEGAGSPHLSYSPEAESNIKLLGDEAPRFDMRDATSPRPDRIRIT